MAERSTKRIQQKVTTSEKAEQLLPGAYVPKSKNNYERRSATSLWLAGMLSICALSCLVYAAGYARGWDALSGYSHNESLTSSQRFLPEPFTPDPGVRGRGDKHSAGKWYYWKLSGDQVSLTTRLFPWLGYTCHQLLIWYTIYRAQLEKAGESKKADRFTPHVSRWNVAACAVNALFCALHFVNTHTTYDGLAQDVSIASSQSSVVVILIMILVMEYKDRGLLFAWPQYTQGCNLTNALRLSYHPVDLIRRYHGYAFSWAAIFTFWYHPMENTAGHVTGAVYCMLIMLQGSLLFTYVHTGPYWRHLLEAWVIVHGGVVAAQTGGPELGGTRLWPMFTFGFALVCAITQVPGLPFLRSRPLPLRLLPSLALLALITWCYSWIPDSRGRPWTRLPEVVRLPLTIYFYFLFTWGLARFLAFLARKVEIRKSSSAVLNKLVYYVLLALAVSVYVFKMGFSVAVEYQDVGMRLTTLSVLVDGLFIFLSCLAFLILDKAFAIVRN